MAQDQLRQGRSVAEPCRITTRPHLMKISYCIFFLQTVAGREFSALYHPSTSDVPLEVCWQAPTSQGYLKKCVWNRPGHESLRPDFQWLDGSCAQKNCTYCYVSPTYAMIVQNCLCDPDSYAQVIKGNMEDPSLERLGGHPLKGCNGDMPCP